MSLDLSFDLLNRISSRARREKKTRLQVGAFELSVIRRNRARLKMSVDQSGEITVSAPLSLPLREIVKFVDENRTWVVEQLAKAESYRKLHPPKTLAEGSHVLFLGIPRVLIFDPIENARGGVRSNIELIENALIVRSRNFDRDSIKSNLRKFFDWQARLHLPERIEYFSKKMGLHPSGLSFRGQRTRWGSCSTAGHISLNIKLMIAPEPVIDYVVIHELSHLKHPNHSENFWSLVATFDENHRQNRRWLNQHQAEARFFDEV